MHQLFKYLVRNTDKPFCVPKDILEPECRVRYVYSISSTCVLENLGCVGLMYYGVWDSWYNCIKILISSALLSVYLI